MLTAASIERGCDGSSKGRLEGGLMIAEPQADAQRATRRAALP
jgi:hypothetical protein